MRKIRVDALLRLAGCCGLLFCMSGADGMNQTTEQKCYDFIKEQCEAVGSPLLKAEMSLLAAVQCNKADCVADLIKKRASSGMNINAQDPNFNRSALHFAVLNNNLEIVRLILAAPEADINLKDRFGQNPLHLAVGLDTPEVVNELLSKANIELNVKDQLGKTPLHYAIVSHKDSNSLDLLRREGINMEQIDDRGNSVLHAASAFNSVMLTYFLRNYAGRLDINARNFEHDTPLHVAAEGLSAEGISILLENGANPILPGKRKAAPIFAAIGSALECDPYLQATRDESGTDDLILHRLLAVLERFVFYGIVPPEGEVIAFLDENEEALDRIEISRKNVIRHTNPRSKLKQEDLQYSLKDLILRTLYGAAAE